MDGALIEQFGNFINQYGYLAIGIAVFLECSLFLGFIAPGESFVVLGGIFASQGKLDLWILFPVVFLGGYIGDLVGFFIGYYLGETIIKKIGKRFGYKDIHFEKVHNFFEKYGAAAVIIGRYLSIFRTLLPATIGTAKYEIRKFVLFDAIGSFLWGSTFILIGYFVGEAWESVKGYAIPISILTFIIGIGVVYFIFRKQKKQES